MAAGVLADLDPPRIGPPGPNPLADIDPPGSISASGFLPPSADSDPLTKFSKNITIHCFLSLFILQKAIIIQKVGV